jgi:hypothetical protein
MSTPISKVKTEDFSMAESKRLIELEREIKQALATFIEVGEALMKIRDSKLYRLEYPSFEDYYRKRWRIKRAHAYRLIESFTIASNLSPIGDIKTGAEDAKESE